MRGKGGTDIVERPLLLVVDLRVPEGLELLHRRRRRHLRSGEIAFLEGSGPGLRVSLPVCSVFFLPLSLGLSSPAPYVDWAGLIIGLYGQVPVRICFIFPN